MLKPFKRFTSDLYSSRFIIVNLVNQELTVKYKRSVLGFLWSLISPLATMIVGAFVFGSIMRFEIQGFVVFLYAAMLPWNFFAISVDSSGSSILNAEGFIKKIYIAKIVFPFSIVCSQFINMLFSMVSMFIIMFFLGARVTVALVFLPVSFLLIIFFTLGLSLVTATVNVYFRDMRHITGVIMSAWYFITPILYPLAFIPEHLQPIFLLNPAYYLIDMFRQPIYYASFPSLNNFLIALAVSLVVFMLGLVVFYKNERDFVYRL